MNEITETIMNWKLFLDDERFPPDNGDEWLIARNFNEALLLVLDHGLPSYISFDHDLGQELSGYDFAKWFADYVILNDKDLPETFDYYVHSMNPVGAENIRKYMENFFEHYRSGT
jgi:hypothetical protein